MKLTKTKAWLDAAMEEKRLGDYSLIVSKGSGRCELYSPGRGEGTLYDIASMGKVLVTATLILRAVGEGKLSLDDTLPRFFDGVPTEKREITIRQLLTHSSGIRRVDLSREVCDRGRAAAAEAILSVPLVFAPESDFIYSCNGYILLGFIAEKLYGAPLDALYETGIRPALSLTRSKFNAAVDEPDAAVCWRRAEVGEYRADDENVYALRGIGGNGASFWSAGDIERYVKAVFAKSPALYAPYLYDEAERDLLPHHVEEGRGLGWLIVDERYRQTEKLFRAGSFGHCGHTGCSFFMNREDELYVIALTNATRYLNMKNGFKGYNYERIKDFREELHGVIRADLEG